MLKTAKKLMAGLLPEPAYRGLQRIFDAVLYVLDVCGFDHLEHTYPAEWHEKMTDAQWQDDATIIASALDDEFSPQSVIDLGCGVGLHLRYFFERDIEVKGVDGTTGAREHAVLPSRLIEIADLRYGYVPREQYDLVICFEVAEHIPARYADQLVDTIGRSGNTIAFTAARPGQGGKHHVNLQPRDYWIDRFRSVGFDYQPSRTEELRKKMRGITVTTWIPDNLFIFERRSPIRR